MDFLPTCGSAPSAGVLNRWRRVFNFFSSIRSTLQVQTSTFPFLLSFFLLALKSLSIAKHKLRPGDTMHIVPAFKISTLAKEPHLTSDSISVLILLSLALNFNVNRINIWSTKMPKCMHAFLFLVMCFQHLNLHILKIYRAVFQEQFVSDSSSVYIVKN